MSAKTTSRSQAAGRNDIDLEFERKGGKKRGNQVYIRPEGPTGFCFLNSTPLSSQSGIETNPQILLSPHC